MVNIVSWRLNWMNYCKVLSGERMENMGNMGNLNSHALLKMGIWKREFIERKKNQILQILHILFLRYS